jgi:hypothetical protein
MMSQNTPIERYLSGLDRASSEALAQINDSVAPADAMRNAKSEANQGSRRSLTAVQKFASAQSVANLREFEQHVVTWAKEWEQAVTERIDRDITAVNKLKGVSYLAHLLSLSSVLISYIFNFNLFRIESITRRKSICFEADPMM